MQALAYNLLHSFEEWNINIEEGNVLNDLNEMGWEDYHNFSKVRLPLSWYDDLLINKEWTTDDVLVEIARVEKDNADKLHYHKLSHALCIILGPKTGFPKCSRGTVQLHNQRYQALINKEFYFPQNCPHTFHGGIETKDNPKGYLYFLSIQSPPLLTKNNDDFYLLQYK